MPFHIPIVVYMCPLQDASKVVGFSGKKTESYRHSAPSRHILRSKFAEINDTGDKLSMKARVVSFFQQTPKRMGKDGKRVSGKKRYWV